MCKLLCAHIQEQLAFEGAAGLLQGGFSVSQVSLGSVCKYLSVSSVPHLEFEIRSPSPGGPKSKPPFLPFCCHRLLILHFTWVPLFLFCLNSFFFCLCLLCVHCHGPLHRQFHRTASSHTVCSLLRIVLYRNS